MALDLSAPLALGGFGNVSVLPSYAKPHTPAGDPNAVNGGQPGPNPLSIGGNTFHSIDCPTELKIGTGEQKMAIAECVGGGKVVHITGFFPDANSWSGIFHQPNIDNNVALLRGFMLDGKERLITWKSEQYYGVVKRFDPTYKKGGNSCPWTLSMEITRAANGAFTPSSPQTSIDDTVAALLTTTGGANAQQIAALGLPASQAGTLMSAASLGNLSPAQISAVQFNNSYVSAVGAVQAATPLATASAASIMSAQQQIDEASAMLPSTDVIPQTQETAAQTLEEQARPGFYGAGPSASASIWTDQASAALSGVSANLGSVQSQSTTQVQGGSLFAIAATKYGDPRQAYSIMQASSLISPILPASVPTALSFPPLAGIFNDGSTSRNLGIAVPP
jgi:hypothetical protein